MDKAEHDHGDDIVIAYHRRNGHPFCFACRKCADMHHRQSRQHKKIIAWLYGLPRVERIKQQKHMLEWAETFLCQKQQEEKAQSAVKADECVPDRQQSTLATPMSLTVQTGAMLTTGRGGVRHG